MATLKNQAAGVWRKGTTFAITAGSGHSVTADGASQAGMSPMELVLAGLVGCIGADVITILQKKRQAVTGLEVQVLGGRMTDHPRCYNSLHVKFLVKGRAVDPEAVRRAIELSETKYCPVTNMLRHTAELTLGFEIIEDAAVAA